MRVPVTVSGLVTLALCEPVPVPGVVPVVSCEPPLVPGLVLLDELAAVGELTPPPPPQADSTSEPAPQTSVERILRRIALGISERVEAIEKSLVRDSVESN
ncbi:hypothetical protein BTHE68_49190 [Burkholderia sp. THE68]|nr:hypothetical protein BTHE68_49190 [Burkholderia sp. THE68]